MNQDTITKLTELARQIGAMQNDPDVIGLDSGPTGTRICIREDAMKLVAPMARWELNDYHLPEGRSQGFYHHSIRRDDITWASTTRQPIATPPTFTVTRHQGEEHKVVASQLNRAEWMAESQWVATLLPTRTTGSEVKYKATIVIDQGTDDEITYYIQED
jgi:hypothetical protein